MKQDGVWAVLGAFHCKKTVSDFLEGFTDTDHFGFLAILKAIMLSFVHKGNNSIM
jgi:hypothetical protein